MTSSLRGLRVSPTDHTGRSPTLPRRLRRPDWIIHLELAIWLLRIPRSFKSTGFPVGMPACKQESQRIAGIARDISTCVENSSLRAHHGNQTLVISLSALSALNITQKRVPYDVLFHPQCSRVHAVYSSSVPSMADAGTRGAVGQAWNTAKGEPSTMLGNYLAACTALKELLVAKDNFCELLESPERCLVGLSENQSKNDLQLEVLRLSPEYDGFKAVVLGIANMTEGLPWPAKAVPQTILQIILHIEQRLCIYIRLRVLAAIHPIKRYLGQQSMNAALAEESQRLGCQIDNTLTTVAAAVVHRIGDDPDISPNAAATSNPGIDLNICSIPLPRPAVFHGRDGNVDELVEIFTTLTVKQDAAILGTGGTGKTSLSLVVLHDPRVLAHFGSQRHFLSCEPLTDAPAALSKLFALPASRNALETLLMHLASRGRTLLVLDNLETVEELLRRLVSIPNLSLLITSRGRAAQWNPLGQYVYCHSRAVSSEAALRTFLDISCKSWDEDQAENHSLVELIKAVDCMPLAVTLLAQLARQCKPSELFSRWRKNERPSGLRPSVFEQLKSMHVTKDVDPPESTARPSVFRRMKAAWSRRQPIKKATTPLFQEIAQARQCLLDHALVSIGPDGEMRVLTMRQIYFTLLHPLPPKSEEFTTKSTAVAAEYENLNVFLLHLINTEEPCQCLLGAVSAVSEYAYLTTPSVTLREALGSRLDHACWLAVCCANIGRTYLKLDDYISASKALLQAIEIFNRIDARQPAAHCALVLGHCQQHQGFVEAAVQRYTAARDIFLEVHDHLNASQCLMMLGDIAADQEQCEDAKQHLTSARSAFIGESKHRLYAAQCTLMLGEIYVLEGNFTMAETELQTAQSEYQAIGDQSGISGCMRPLGDLRRRQRDFSSAEELLVSAREQFIRMGMPLDQANCIYDIGLLRRDQGRTQEALEAFRTAAQIYERIGAAGELKKCRREIERLDNV
ncbi:hypothetical protein BKA62DRAFT_762876 [Auriculariales sp. MPI-PUGE-AT-0066]|nr:hypothetical protein BKA62DRAFT_762876 [Auriculariales sp. MPI-PUGE-AT-0066]